MKDQNDSHRQFAELLWVEINKAILNSPEVRKSVQRLKSLGMLQHMSKYDLVLDIEKLIELAQKEENLRSESVEETSLEFSPEALRERQGGAMGEDQPSTQSECSPETLAHRKQRVDGKVLSVNEMRFQQYLESNFDETLWMKQTKIRWE